MIINMVSKRYLMYDVEDVAFNLENDAKEDFVGAEDVAASSLESSCSFAS